MIQFIAKSEDIYRFWRFDCLLDLLDAYWGRKIPLPLESDEILGGEYVYCNTAYQAKQFEEIIMQMTSKYWEENMLACSDSNKDLKELRLKQLITNKSNKYCHLYVKDKEEEDTIMNLLAQTSFCWQSENTVLINHILPPYGLTLDTKAKKVLWVLPVIYANKDESNAFKKKYKSISEIVGN